MKKGFTLIELLIIISIIALLSLAVIIGVSGTTGRSKATAAKQSMRSMLPYMMLCVGGSSTTTPVVAGNFLCANSSITDAKWPQSPTGCETPITSNTLGKITAVCDGITVTCEASKNSCSGI